jgi:hypothetical protein
MCAIGRLLAEAKTPTDTCDWQNFEGGFIALTHKMPEIREILGYSNTREREFFVELQGCHDIWALRPQSNDLRILLEKLRTKFMTQPTPLRGTTEETTV